MNRRIYLQTMGMDGEGLNKSIEVSYDDDGQMITLVEAFREFASALGFYEGTIDRFIVNPYDFPEGINDLNDIGTDEFDKYKGNDVFSILNDMLKPPQKR